MIINFGEYKAQNQLNSNEQNIAIKPSSTDFGSFKNKRKELAVQRAISRAKKQAW